MIKNKMFFYNHADQARFFHGKKCAAGKTYQTECAAGQIF